MAENHDEQEGPIHQAPWVFFVTVGVCYAVLTLIMFAKFMSESASVAEIGELFGYQALVFTVFCAVFGGFLYVANKLIGSTSESPDH